MGLVLVHLYRHRKASHRKLGPWFDPEFGPGQCAREGFPPGSLFFFPLTPPNDMHIGRLPTLPLGMKECVGVCVHGS